MKTYTIRPLQWDKESKQTWVAQGIAYTYLITAEHEKVRLYCTKAESRAELYDYSDYYEAMVGAEQHHQRTATRFLKEVIQ